jgi:predicted AlkP superfamily phosphohydrolase/phosphomutase
LSKKLLVIGFDGASFRIIKPLVDRGKLPTFKKVLNEGVHSILKSTIDTNSPCAWSTFITGKNPGKHGIFGFFENIPNSYNVRFINGSFRNGKSIWKILSEHGKRVGVMNVPFSYPVDDVNGFMIGGPDSPSKYDYRFAFPEGIIREIEASTGKYIIEAGASALVRKGKLNQAIDKLHECIRTRTSVAKNLLEKDNYDFFMVVFTESDRVQHHFWKYINPLHPAYSWPEKKRFENTIYEVYEELDGALKEILDTAGENFSLLVMSDHGAGPSSNVTLFLNRWLRSEGYLSFKSRISLQDYTVNSLERGFSKAYVLAKSRLSRTWKRRLRKFMPGLKNKAVSKLRSLQLDWENTKAFSWENAPTIYINLKNKFPCGNVEPGKEYEKIREDLRQKILDITHPANNKRVVEKVYTKEEVYWGPYSDRAPDLFIEFKDDQCTVRPGYASKRGTFFEVITGERLKKVEIISRPSGVHNRDGIFLFHGNDIKRGTKIEELCLYDISSTILYYLGIPIPSDFDGKVVTDVFTEKFLGNNPIRYSEGSSEREAFDVGYSKEESEIIAERLQGLGYID